MKKMMVMMFAAVMLMATNASAACIDTPGDVDWFTYENDVVTGNSVTVAVLGGAYGLDPVVYVYDIDSVTVIGSNDDRGVAGPKLAGIAMQATDSVFTFTPANVGTYWIGVVGFDPATSAGCYELVVRDNAIPNLPRTAPKK
jgi:hypothetical protein